MQKKATATIIGSFVLGAAALVVAGVILFGSGRYFKDTLKYVSYFDGDVKGLNSGATVNFRGVQVGEVTDVQVTVDANDGSIRIPVYYEIDPAQINEVGQVGARMDPAEYVQLLVEKGLKAQLSVRSFLTGQLCIELDFFPDAAITLINGDPSVSEIPTVPSRLEMITQSLQEIPFREIFDKLLSVANGLNNIINSPKLEQGFDALGGSLERINHLVEQVDSRLGPVMDNLDATLTETRELVSNVDQKLVPETQATLGSARSLIDNLNADLGPLLAELEQTLSTASRSMEQASSTMSSIDDVLAEDSEVRFKLVRALDELAEAARAVRFMAEYLERNPEALISGKGSNDGR